MSDDPLNWPLAGINLAATIIYCYAGNNRLASASGFFFQHQNQKYLVTNRHVVLVEEEEYCPDYIKIVLHSDIHEPRKNIIVKLDLYSSEGASKWLEHPQYRDLECDIVLIPLPEKQIASACINFHTEENFLSDNIHVPPFSDVVVIGYPLAFHDEENNLPVYRKGMLASPYPFGFKNKPCSLIDANLHHGTSGSMVLNSPHNLLINRTGASFHTSKALLLGVFSAEYNVSGNNLGLNIVWHAPLLVEIANSGI